jgi:ABC-type antimicrobial peptide transport system permease subunit
MPTVTVNGDTPTIEDAVDAAPGRASAEPGPACGPGTFAHANHWAVQIPVSAVGVTVAIGLGVGVAAGLYPALKAAMLQPTEAPRAV